ncbi:MAG: tripartite tricarboxylate transporter TctB family protein [Burkholderiales bacterium]
MSSPISTSRTSRVSGTRTRSASRTPCTPSARYELDRPVDGREGRHLNLRRDHVAGGAFVAGGALLFAASGDLPFGTLASPGAGMLPTLIIGLMILFGLALVASAGASPRLAEIEWRDLPHALRVIALAATATALYTVLGFIVTMSLMLFALIFAVERRRIVRAAAVSIGVTLLAYLLFNTLLKSPLPQGVMPF